MKTRLGNAFVVLLIIGVALLAFEVTQKMSRTSVAEQRIDPVPTVQTTTKVAPPAVALSAVFIGDFTDGSNEGGKGEKNWTALIGTDINKRFPVRVIADSSSGGSGYVVRGASPTFSDQVRRLVTPEAKVVTMSGSRNDSVADPAAVTRAALETFGLIHSLAPRAALIVIGPSWGRSEPTGAVLATRDAVRDAAQNSGAYFVDPIEDGWFTNGDPGLLGADNVQPTDAGNRRIADLMFPVMATVLNPAS